MSWDLIFQHLFIVLAASLLSIAVGLPLGIWAYVSKTARPVILRIVDLLQTIPSLALLGIIMVVLDPGKLTVITGITLYSLLPIVRNTCLGLQEVDPGVKEAARGMIPCGHFIPQGSCGKTSRTRFFQFSPFRMPSTLTILHSFH